MADANLPTELGSVPPPPTRTNDEILPHNEWVSTGKSNLYIDVDKPQNNPTYKVAVDILKNTSFLKAFTVSSSIPSIYIQQFWNTMTHNKENNSYRCQLDEQWFEINKETLRNALQINPILPDKPFSSPPNPEVLLEFVNELGYP
jgi:hypothetical protein